MKDVDFAAAEARILAYCAEDTQMVTKALTQSAAIFIHPALRSIMDPTRMLTGDQAGEGTGWHLEGWKFFEENQEFNRHGGGWWLDWVFCTYTDPRAWRQENPLR